MKKQPYKPYQLRIRQKDTPETNTIRCVNYTSTTKKKKKTGQEDNSRKGKVRAKKPKGKGKELTNPPRDVEEQPGRGLVVCNGMLKGERAV